MSEPSRFRLGVAYAAICVIWGSTYLAIKVGLESFSPLFYAGVRYTLATALGFVVAHASGVTFAGPLRRWLPVAGIGVLLIAVSNGLVFWSETRLDSGFTALLLTTSPLWSALLSPLFPGEPGPRVLGWVGIVVGFAGTVVMLEPWRAGAAVLLAVSLVEGRTMVGPLTARAAASLAYLVVVGSVIAFAAYFYLLQHWGATRVATSTYVNPVVAVVLGALLLREAVTWSMVAGAAVVFAGVTLVLRDQQTVARA